jgi:hypothetical protein
LQGFYSQHRFAIVGWPELQRAFVKDSVDARIEIAGLYKQWLIERRGDQDIARPEYRILVSAGLRPSSEDRTSAFERLGRLIARQMTRVGKYATKPF